MVEPYCKAAWPDLASEKSWCIRARVRSTGSDSSSVNPAAREISPGWFKVRLINQEIGGAVMRRLIIDRPEFFFINST